MPTQIATDTHPPGEYRSDVVRNVDAWYKAYNVVNGDKLYVKPKIASEYGETL